MSAKTAKFSKSANLLYTTAKFAKLQSIPTVKNTHITRRRDWPAAFVVHLLGGRLHPFSLFITMFILTFINLNCRAGQTRTFLRIRREGIFVTRWAKTQLCWQDATCDNAKFCVFQSVRPWPNIQNISPLYSPNFLNTTTTHSSLSPTTSQPPAGGQLP